eukprot:8675134-Pyramimonas_sp.AAC.1
MVHGPMRTPDAVPPACLRASGCPSDDTLARVPSPPSLGSPDARGAASALEGTAHPRRGTLSPTRAPPPPLPPA